MTNKKSLIALLFTTGIAMMSLFAFVPMIAPLIRELGLAEWQGGLIVSIAGGFWMFFAPKWGRLSDRRGRKFVILSGIVGFFISYLAMVIFLHFALETALLSSLAILILFILTRSLMGVFFGAIPSSAAANIADITTAENRTKYMAMMGATQGLGIILGPMFASFFAGISLLAPLYAAAFLPLIALVIILVFLTNAAPKLKGESVKLKFSDARIRLPLIVMLLTTSGSMTANMCVGYFMMDRFTLTTTELSVTLGYTLASAGLLSVAVQFVIMKFKHVKPLTWIKIGSFIAFLSFALLTFMSNILVFILFYCLAAGGLTFINPAAMSYASQAVENTEQGAVSGNMSSVQGFSSLIIPLLSTSIYGINMFLPYVITSVLFAVLLILIVIKNIKYKA